MKNNNLQIVVAVGMVFFAGISLQAQQYVWSQYAGNPSGGAGFADGDGTIARFSYPNSVAVDATGTVYVADSGNHTIRKMMFSGTTCTVSTLAGTPGVSGTSDGTGSAAQFNNPSGVAVDSSGNVVVADTGNNTIRKITPSGQVITLAGSPGAFGYADGTGSGAQFGGPIGIAVDSSLNIYVSDAYSHTIRKVTSGGVVSTLAGSPYVSGFADGNGSGALFNSPGGLAVDASGNLYVADTLNNTIRKVTPSGQVTTFAGSPTVFGAFDGNGLNATFNLPGAVAVDGAGNVVVADTYNATLRMISPNRDVITLSGSTRTSGFSDGAGTVAKFNFPSGVAVDGNGNVYVADTGNHTIRKEVWTVVSTVAGSAPKIGVPAAYIGYGFYVSTPYGAYNYPTGIAVDASGNVFSTDTQNQIILKNGILFAGTILQRGNQDGTGSGAYFNFPQGIVIDSGTNLYVADTRNNSIRMLSRTAVSTTICGGGSSMGSADGTGANAQFNNPVGIALDSGTNLYVADTYNSTIRKLTHSGATWTASTIAGTAQVTGTTDGSGNGALFAYPSGVAVDSGTNVYVADSGNGTIRRLTLVSGTWNSQTIAGTPGVTGTADGVGAAAQFGYPTMMSFDSLGNLFVVDTGNSTVRMLTNTGGYWSVTTVGGTPGVNGGIPLKGDAVAQAQFSAPMGIAIRSGTAVGNDQIFVMDTGNNRIVLGQSLGTKAASGITKGSGVLSGMVDPNGQDTQVYFQYGKTLSYGSVTGTQSIGNGFSPLQVSSSLTGLSNSTQYNYQMVVVNASGTFYGVNQIFTTLPGSAPVISSTTAITGTNGFPLRYTITASNTPTGFGAGTLPAGISFNPVTGVISGVPTVTGSTTVLLSASNGIGIGTANLGLTIVDLALPVITSSGTSTGIYGSSFNYTIAATNSPTSYNATGLPSWMEVNPGNGLLSGIPTAVGAYPVTISAINATGTTTMALVVTVTPPYLWNNLAGSLVVTGTTNGTGTNALFNDPVGMVIDSGSNLYVADNYNYTIRKITPAGVVSTFAGIPGVNGTTNGPRLSASFFYPTVLAVDSASNIYVADSVNNMIRKITPAGVVSTLAGTGVSGTANGPVSSAQFGDPYGIAVDSGSNVYVADTGNHTIRKITVTGTVSTLAGSGVNGSVDGTGTNAQFNVPCGIAVDSGSNVYVADSRNNVIRKVTPAGVVTTLAGHTGGVSVDGTEDAAAFTNPMGMAIDRDGNLFVTDSNAVRKMSLSSGSNGHWFVTTLTGGRASPANLGGIGMAANFGIPQGVAVDGNGNLFVTDYYSLPPNTISRVSRGSVLQAPSITSALSASGTEGTSFNYTITATTPGNASLNFNATGFVPGLFVDSLTGLISGSPAINGTFALGISASNIAGTGSATLMLSLLPGNPYEAWQGQMFSQNQFINPAISGDLLAPAGDGISNLMKYALHLNPFVNGVSGLPIKSIVNVSGSNYLALTYTKVIAATDLTYTVEISNDLQTWNSGPSYTTTTNVTANLDGVTQSVTVRSLVPLSVTAPKQFIRLRVSH